MKVRLDDNLGTTMKIPREAIAAAVARARAVGLPVAAHLFYLDDAKFLVRSGIDLVAHSVRDLPVDAEFIDLLRQRDVCYSPTLMREVSTFVYETRPGFLDDPFFRRDADPAAIEGVQTPQHQASNRTPAAARYKLALEQAKKNLKTLHDAGVKIAMGTDTGPAGRFQGYFEHLELEQMVSAGLTPMQVLVAATRNSAEFLRMNDAGTLAANKSADFIVLDANPVEDIANTRRISAVYLRGAAVDRASSTRR